MIHLCTKCDFPGKVTLLRTNENWKTKKTGRMTYDTFVFNFFTIFSYTDSPMNLDILNGSQLLLVFILDNIYKIWKDIWSYAGQWVLNVDK